MIYLLTVENLNDAHHANSFTGRTVTAFKPSHGGGMTLLRAAYDAAQTLKRDVWEFAVEIEQLHALGVTNTALRLLLCEGYAIHAVERTSTSGSVAGCSGRSLVWPCLHEPASSWRTKACTCPSANWIRPRLSRPRSICKSKVFPSRCPTVPFGTALFDN